MEAIPCCSGNRTSYWSLQPFRIRIYTSIALLCRQYRLMSIVFGYPLSSDRTQLQVELHKLFSKSFSEHLFTVIKYYKFVLLIKGVVAYLVGIITEIINFHKKFESTSLINSNVQNSKIKTFQTYIFKAFFYFKTNLTLL